MDFENDDNLQEKAADENINAAGESEEYKECAEVVPESKEEQATGEPQNATPETAAPEEACSAETVPENENCACKETELLSELKNLTDRVEQLGKQFEAKIMHTTHEEKIVDQMHAELQKYKEDMYAQLVRPILMDIIEMRDSILRMSKAYSEKPENEQAIPLKTFSDYAFDIQDILEKNNINIYKSEEGGSFTPLRQRVVKKIPTPVEELHGKIAESLSDGYEYLGKTISPEKITVYVYENK